MYRRVGQSKIQLIVIACRIPISICLSVFVLHMFRHVLIFVIPRHIIRTDTYAMCIHCKHLITSRKGKREFPYRRELTKYHLQNSRLLCIKACCQSIQIWLCIADFPGQRNIQISNHGSQHRLYPQHHIRLLIGFIERMKMGGK